MLSGKGLLLAVNPKVTSIQGMQKAFGWIATAWETSQKGLRGYPQDFGNFRPVSLSNKSEALLQFSVEAGDR